MAIRADIRQVKRTAEERCTECQEVLMHWVTRQCLCLREVEPYLARKYHKDAEHDVLLAVIGLVTRLNRLD